MFVSLHMLTHRGEGERGTVLKKILKWIYEFYLVMVHYLEWMKPDNKKKIKLCILI